MRRKEYFPLHDVVDVVEQMVACIVEVHADQRERRDVLTVVLQGAVDARAEVQVSKRVECHEFDLLVGACIRFLFFSFRVFR